MKIYLFERQPRPTKSRFALHHLLPTAITNIVDTSLHQSAAVHAPKASRDATLLTLVALCP